MALKRMIPSWMPSRMLLRKVSLSCSAVSVIFRSVMSIWEPQLPVSISSSIMPKTTMRKQRYPPVWVGWTIS